MVIPEEYVIQKFYQHAGYPKYIKSTNTYMGGCPVCREGSSWGRKSRCYYIPKDTVICCHNCGWYSKPVAWLMEIEKIPFDQVMKQIEQGDFEYGLQEIEEPPVIRQVSDLPVDCINLFDKHQLNYYKDNKVVRAAAELIVARKLNKAINRPKSVYISLSDNVHKNRLIIPFYDHKGHCIFYQSRTVIPDNTRPKYLSKMNSEKSLFNYDNIQSSADNIFITEGPIDAFFIKNSVAVAGIQERSRSTYTPQQQKQLDRLFLKQTIWVLDSQWQDEPSRKKSEILLKDDQCVFIWPKDIGQRFKDINEMCVFFDINEISSKFILDNTYCGLRGIVRLKQLR